MIVTTSPFILSAQAAGFPLNLARIGYQTFGQSAVPSDITASTEATGFPKDAPLRTNTYEYWKPTALPATWVQEFGSTRSIDYVGIAAHNLFTCAASVKVEYQLGAGAWTTFAADTAPGDNTPLMFLGAAVNASRIRVTVSGASVMPSIGVIYVGAALVMQMEIGEGFTPINLGRDTVTTNVLSRGGQFIAQGFRSNGVQSKVSYRFLTSDWVRANFDTFSKSARNRPYFWAWNPLLRPQDVGYVWTEKDILPMYSGMRDLMDVTWMMQGIGQA